MKSGWTSRFRRRISPVHVAIDAPVVALALFLSLFLRLGQARIGDHWLTLVQLAPILIPVRLAIFVAFGVYRSLWRYVSTGDAFRLGSAVLLSVPCLISVTYVLPSFGYLPRSFFVIDALVASALLMSVRLLRRHLFERQMRPQKGHATLGKLLIFGAGQNGRLLAQRLLTDPARDRELLGFIDDDPRKQGHLIHSLPVLGGQSDLEDVLVSSGCTELVVAITNPPADLMRDLVVLGRRLGVRVQKIAHLEATQRSEALYRQIELTDLLNRPSSVVDLNSVKGLLENQVVLVTGAGGSIGSELARQIARFSPRKLLLLDHSEFNLYEIDRELRPATQSFDVVVPILADIKDRDSLGAAFAAYRPTVVFHAAAYKHVHLVEANVTSAVLNNVEGTKNLLELCETTGVERFVMISTDKAVNPGGAMGATKRVCELLTSAQGRRLNRPYSSVRFGNVLGSSGSLIPLLKKQIEDGGPVTLTHPDMTRFFMLIPEAVSLVLMSSTLSEPGDINVLKMGEPIRILDLAKSLIAMMGKTEDDCAIAFTGVRPGEKMFEELYLTGAELATRHPDILTVPHQRDAAGLGARVDHLLELAHRADPATMANLRDLANEEWDPKRAADDDQAVLRD